MFADGPQPCRMLRCLKSIIPRSFGSRCRKSRGSSIFSERTDYRTPNRWRRLLIRRFIGRGSSWRRAGPGGALLTPDRMLVLRLPLARRHDEISRGARYAVSKDRRQGRAVRKVCERKRAEAGIRPAFIGIDGQKHCFAAIDAAYWHDRIVTGRILSITARSLRNTL